MVAEDVFFVAPECMNPLIEVESSWELDEQGDAIINIAMPNDEMLAFKMCKSWYNQLRDTKAKPQIAFHLRGRGDFVTTPFDNFADLPTRYAERQGGLNKLKQIPAEPNAPDYCYIFFQDHTGNRYYLGNNEWDKEQFLIQLPEKATPPTNDERAERLRRQAEDAFAHGDFEKAKDLCNKILAIAPNVHTGYARETLAKIEQEILRRQAIEQINQVIEQIKQTFQAEQYEECLALCEQVLNNPNASLTQKDQARRYAVECREKLKGQKEQANLVAYHQLIQKADALFEQKNWNEAKRFYKGASNLRPDEPYPKEQIAKIEKLLAEERREKAFVWARNVGILLLLLLFLAGGWYFSQSKPAWEAVRAKKVLRVGLHTYSPIDKEKFAETIAQQILQNVPELKGVTLKTTENADFKNLSDMLKSGELDMVFHAGMGKDESVIWSNEAYWTFDKVVAFFPDREGKAVDLSYFTSQLVEIHEKDPSVAQFGTGWNLKKMVSGESAYLGGDKTLHGLICDLPTCLLLQKQHKNLQYLRAKGYEGRYHLAFKNENGSMRNEVDKLLVKIKQTTTYKNLIEKLEK